MKRPKIVCICGSTRFKDEWEQAIMDETTDGKIVLAVAFYTHADKHIISDEFKKRLNALHLKKIDLADEILVINKDDYIGESTTNEIRHARSQGKPVRFRFGI